VANKTLRGRAGGPSRQRSVAAAARAAAKRSQTARQPDQVAADSGSAPDAAAGQQAEPAAEETHDGERVPSAPRRLFARRRQARGTTQTCAGTETEQTTDSPRRLRLLSAVLAVLVTAGLATATALGLQYRDAERTAQARGGALAAARTVAPVVLSYDYRHLTSDFAAAESHLTGSFLDQYRKTTQTVVGPTATKYHGVVKATVAQPPGGAPAVSVVSASPDGAVVLLFMNQVTTSTEISGPRLDLNRVRMTMTRTPGGWEVSGIDAL
jgi:Mce-associated membrane protein